MLLGKGFVSIYTVFDRHHLSLASKQTSLVPMGHHFLLDQTPHIVESRAFAWNNFAVHGILANLLLATRTWLIFHTHDGDFPRILLKNVSVPGLLINSGQASP